MSKINRSHVFTSESVGEGHPDKVCDIVSDAVLDACLNKDSSARVACETATTTNWLTNFGELRVQGLEGIDIEDVVRNAIKEIGYDREEYLFSYNTFKYQNLLHSQSPEIAQGVDESEGKEQGAGDQGMMFGYATNETKEFMPTPIALSHGLLKHLSQIRKNKEISYLRPDAKAQISVRYNNSQPEAITSVVISHQTDDISLDDIKQDLIKIAQEYLDSTNLLDENTQYYINPTGKFVIGGPHGDAGLTGRKIIVDTYGGVGSHGGGAFSGKDPSKVDRSAAYYARYAAKNIVAAGIADKCEIQVSYAIGIHHPISINVATYGTSKVDENKIEKMLSESEIFDFRPARLTDELQLRFPTKNNWRYVDTASYGHFGREEFPWENCNKVDQIKNYLI